MGELEHERRAAARLRLDADLAAHPSRQLAADVEAEAGSARRLRQVRIDPVELLEDRLLLARRDADAPVGDGQPDVPGFLAEGDGDRAARRRVLAGAVEQADQDLRDAVAVARGEGRPRRVENHVHAELWLKRLDRTARELGDVDAVVLD